MKKITFSIIVFLLAITSYSQYSLTRIIPPDATSNGSGMFGGSPSMDGNTIIAGGNSSGIYKIHVFEDLPSGITETALLQSPENNQTLWNAIIHGDYIYIGSPSNNTNVSNGGAVYVFKKIANVWTYLTKLQPLVQNAGDSFGVSLAFENNQLFIGVSGYESQSSPAGTNTGAIFVYDKLNDNFTFNQILTTNSNNSLGSFIDIEQNILISTNTNGTTNESKVVTYKKTNGVWAEINSLPFQYRNYDFIKRVNYSNNQLFVVESNQYSINTTTIIIYDLQTDNSWLQTSSFSAPMSDYFSAAINVKNNNMLLSGFGGYMLQMSRKNPTKYYKKINGSWTYQASFVGQGPHTEDDTMGHESFITDNVILIGNTYENWGTLPYQSHGSLYKLDVTLGAHNFEKGTFLLYPNPSTNKIFINSENKNIKTLELFDVSGKKVQIQTVNTSEMLLDQIASGIYLLKITDDEGNASFEKIIKK